MLPTAESLATRWACAFAQQGESFTDTNSPDIFLSVQSRDFSQRSAVGVDTSSNSLGGFILGHLLSPQTWSTIVSCQRHIRFRTAEPPAKALTTNSRGSCMTRALRASCAWLHRLPPQLFLGTKAGTWLCPLSCCSKSTLAPSDTWISPWESKQHCHSLWPSITQWQLRQYSGAADRENFEWLGGLPHPAPRDSFPNLDTNHM